MEAILLNLYLGSIVFFLSSVILAFVLYNRIKKNRTLFIGLIIISQFVVVNLISLLVWRFWIFDIDFMFMFISLPAIIAEAITIPIVLSIKRKK